MKSKTLKLLLIELARVEQNAMIMKQCDEQKCLLKYLVNNTGPKNNIENIKQLKYSIYSIYLSIQKYSCCFQ